MFGEKPWVNDILGVAQMMYSNISLFKGTLLRVYTEVQGKDCTCNWLQCSGYLSNLLCNAQYYSVPDASIDLFQFG